MNMGSGVFLIPCFFLGTGRKGIPDPEKEQSEQIRNPKHEIPGPDPATPDSVLRSRILARTEYICEPSMSRQGGPKQYPMFQIQMTETVGGQTPVLNIEAFEFRICFEIRISCFEFQGGSVAGKRDLLTIYDELEKCFPECTPRLFGLPGKPSL
jgi:hypothetical protein